MKLGKDGWPTDGEVIGLRDKEIAGLRAILEEALRPFQAHADDSTNPAWVSKARNLMAGEKPDKPRILVTVKGGVADHVADPGIDVEVFDFDNHEADPERTSPLPAHFRDLAEHMGAPCEEV